MDRVDVIVASVMREMGCDPSSPVHWVSQEYCSVVGNKVPHGYVCSRCGKHSWSKRRSCDGCGSTIKEG